MKKIMLLALTALMALAVALPASAGHKTSHDPPGQDKVQICHFPGHEAEHGHHGDFYVTGQGHHCRDDGGKVITVSRKAAEKGHGAAAHTSHP